MTVHHVVPIIRDPTRRTAVNPSRFLLRWMSFVTLGEGAGFAVAAATGVWVAIMQPSPVLAFAMLLGAGAVEGALLGVGQVLAMRTLPVSPSMLWRWPLVTGLGAVTAWSVGLVPSSLPDVNWSSPVTWLAAGPLSVVVLAAIPVAQLILLRRVVRRSWRWLPANMLGWLVGISWTFAVSPLVDAGTPIVQLVGLYVAAGVLMALTVATTTGLCWVGWLRHGDLRGTAGPMSGPVPTLGHADRST